MCTTIVKSAQSCLEVHFEVFLKKRKKNILSILVSTSFPQELFGAVGPLKKAKLLKSGQAEVVYVNKKDAVSAVQKYHSRELDGKLTA